MPCNLNDCGSAPAQAADLLPFSFNGTSLDVNKNGVVDEGDRFTGHFNLDFPNGIGSASSSVDKIHANIVVGAVCGFGDNSGCFSSNVANLGASPIAARAANLAGAGPVRDFIRLHPRTGLAFFVGFFRLSGKNPDSCDEADGDCRLALVLAFDLDNIAGPSNGDLLLANLEGGPAFAGLVKNGNLSITSEIVKTP